MHRDTRKAQKKAIGLALGIASLIVILAGSTVAMGAVRAWAAPGRPTGSDRAVTIMTQNLDEGTDFGPAASATTPLQFVTAVTNIWLQVQATNPPARAAAVAHEIALAQPDLVAVQEAAVFRTGATRPATTVVYDQLHLVLDALTQEGAHYAPIAVTTNIDLEAPTLLGYDVRLTDENALLARTDLPTSQLTLSHVQAQTFTTNLVVTNPVIGTLTFPCSWIALDAKIRGKTFRFVTAHLESFPPVQAAQANELVQGPGNTALPVVFAGDFNSNAEQSGGDQTATYPELIAAGYRDAWSAAHPSDPGYTWPLYLEDPLITPATPSERIDLVLVRNGISVEQLQLVGDTAADRLPFGLTPSDHAGVVASLRTWPEADDSEAGS